MVPACTRDVHEAYGSVHWGGDAILPSMTLTLSLSQVLLVVLGLVGGLGAVGYLIWRGVWSKSVQPLVVAEIATYHAKTDVAEAQRQFVRNEIIGHFAKVETQDAHRLMIRNEFALLQNQPDHVEKRLAFIKKALDDEIRRDDGLIHRELATKFDAHARTMDSKMDRILDAMSRRDEKQDIMLGRMAKLEGMLAMLLKGSAASTPD